MRRIRGGVARHRERPSCHRAADSVMNSPPFQLIKMHPLPLAKAHILTD